MLSTNSTLHRSLLLLSMSLAAACGDPGTGEGGGPNATRVEDPKQYLDALPAFPEAPEPFDRAVGPADFDHTDGQVCGTTTYEIGDAPAEVVMFNTDPQVFWPGALIQGDSYEDGSPMLIPLPNRAPLSLSIQGVYANVSAARDIEPTQSAVTQAVNGLLAEAVRDGIPSTQSVVFNQKEAYSFEQASLKLGFSARYLGSRVRGSLSYSTTTEQNTVMANATIRTFTVSVDQPPTPSAFFEGLTADELDEQIALGRLSEENLPVYVASVTYGQIMMFSATSTASMSDLKGALSASFNSFAGGGSGKLEGERKEILDASEITVVTLGGSEEGVAEMIRDGNPGAFFERSSVVTSSVPIAYTLKDLRGNVVKVGESTEYALTTCTAAGTANLYAVSGSEDGAAVLGYYADGSEAQLTTPIAASPYFTGAPTKYLDVVYDSAHDTVRVLEDASPVYVQDDAIRRVQSYAAHGALASDEPITVNGRTVAIAYDRNYGRLYTAGSYGDGRVLEVYNDAGANLGIVFATSVQWVVPRAATYDARRDRIYVAAEIAEPYAADAARPTPRGTVLVFDLQGNELDVDGDFEGLFSPRGITYDENLDRIYVTDAWTETVEAFDADGERIELEWPIDDLSEPRGVTFDPTHNQLYVVNYGSSLITAYEPDGTPAGGLATPAFSTLNRPTAVAFRPF